MSDAGAGGAPNVIGGAVVTPNVFVAGGCTPKLDGAAEAVATLPPNEGAAKVIDPDAAGVAPNDGIGAAWVNDAPLSEEAGSTALKPGRA